ncbi:MAG: hypothetical protein ABSE63_11700 [Thermoguttaceae bacterium]|jgi:hypothetical protein
MSTDFITGIYNYCDRWCERCAFTARCLVFAREKKYFGDQTEHDLKSDAFWKTMQGIFSDTKALIQQTADEHGIDLNAVDQEELDRDMKAMKRVQHQARQHPLVVRATRYAETVNNWFKQHESSFQQKGDDLASLELMQLNGHDPEAEAISLNDACDVIRWYQFQIAVKFSRALTSDGQRELLDEEAMQADSLGSAKVALLAIDRSVAAWAILRGAFPEHADAILDILVNLDRLRRAGESRFPDARPFIRPGLDG